MATILQLLFFLGASLVERMFHQRCLVFNLWNRLKNLLLINKKMRKKNQIPKYHILSSKEMMKKIRDQLIKNLLIQWDTKEENQKILNIFGEKPLNLIEN